MNILNTAVRTAIKRPFIIIFFALLMLACAFLNSVNPLIPIVAGLINITGTSLYESIVSALQVIFEPSFIPGFLLVLLGLALVASLLAGALFMALFMGKSLVEEACTKNEIAGFIRRLDIEHLKKGIPDDGYTNIADYLIKDFLQNP